MYLKDFSFGFITLVLFITSYIRFFYRDLRLYTYMYNFPVRYIWGSFF